MLQIRRPMWHKSINSVQNRSMNWDNLRYVLLIAEHGSVAAAARFLGVNRTTVLRRLNGFEEELGTRLFHRGEGSYTLTAGGEHIVPDPEVVKSVGEYGMPGEEPKGEREWPGLLRQLDRIDPSFRT